MRPAFLFRLLSEDEARLVVRIIVWAVALAMAWPLLDRLTALAAAWVHIASSPL